MKGYHDIGPRMGAAYDLFGNAKTSLKVNVGRYLEAASPIATYVAANPTARITTTTTRSWSDVNRNFVPDCDLLNPAANGGECGAFANRNFGTAVFSSTFDPALLEGWRVRPWDWQFGLSVQHELFPRTGVEVGYHRRWFNGYAATDNRAVRPSDYDPFSITAPADPRLPGGGGYAIGDLYNINPVKFGQVDNFRTTVGSFGTQVQYWHGVDVNVTARLKNGLAVQGGTSTGRPVTDTCDVIIDDPSRRNCHIAEPFRTQLKGLATYTIPKIDVQVSGTFQSTPGVPLAANYNVPSAVVQQTLGRPLAGGVANVLVNLLDPGQMYGVRINQLDFRVAKIFRFRRVRTNIGVDLYNALNSALEDIKGDELASIRRGIQEQTRTQQLTGEDQTGGTRWIWLESHNHVKGSMAWFVVDPTDGKIPPMTKEAQQRQAARAEARRASGRGPADSWIDRSLYDRCITRGLPGSMMPAGYGSSYQIVQSPGYVAIRYEMVHETRIIPLDGRPHLGQALRSYMGDARGRWERDTLVVETSNFKAETAYRGADPATLRLIERLTRVAPDKVRWAVTVQDPTTWTRPWTFAMPLTIDDNERLFEYACHEGNYAMSNILSGARAQETAAEEAATKR